MKEANFAGPVTNITNITAAKLKEYVSKQLPLDHAKEKIFLIMGIYVLRNLF